jgi:hypothetical protein
LSHRLVGSRVGVLLILTTERSSGFPVMAWDSKLSYPPEATRTLSVKATPFQQAAWGEAARLLGKASVGAFLA